MFLSDTDIKKAIRKGDITIKPFVSSKIQPVSYDIRLGNKFVFNEDTKTRVVDPEKKLYAPSREIKVAEGEEFVLHPGTSVLGVSKEFFGSNMYLIQLGGKSSLARIGLMIHNTAGIVNPGHFLNVTFEITNQNNIPIILRPGMEIAQILFSTISSPPSRTYKMTGRFAQNNWNHFIPKKKLTKRATKKKK